MGRLSKFSSISSQKEFSSVYKEAVKWHCEEAIVFFKPCNENKLAVVASKKVGKAVVRNRCKRLLRAVVVEISNELADGIYVIVVKNGLDKSSFLKLKKNISWAMKKLGCIKSGI
ncbi:ribonuclease P protein component [Campylobacter sp.]|uniref:ribonuclease P protein component n=1 Tax=Campylobacter TaxID=194 RepID=UPI0036129CB3